jgi:hypothetical protein
MLKTCVRQILPNVKDFKIFWKDKGPFRYALTSSEFPPVLMEPEEWIFGNDIMQLLKELMQFDQRKMAFVRAPFNPDNKSILRPDGLSPWKITHFPEQWNVVACDAFVPEGHLTNLVMEKAKTLMQPVEPLHSLKDQNGKQNMEMSNLGKQDMEKSFFSLVEQNLEDMGYLLLKPTGNSKSASTNAYLREWEEDEKDAGLL